MFHRRLAITGACLAAWYCAAMPNSAPATPPAPDLKKLPLVDPALIKIRAVTRGPKFHWFGYYDKFQFDVTGRYLLAHEVDFEQRLPTADDVVKIGMIDLADGDKWIELAETHAWSWQQGSMLQWRPGSATEIVFNDREGDHFVCRVLDVKTRKMRTLPMAIDTLSHDGKLALCCDYRRIANIRPGYGYAGLADPNRDQLAPKDVGVFRMDMETGATKLLVSVADLAKVPYAEATPKDRHYVNHPQFSPDDQRFFVFDRWVGGVKGQPTRVFTARSADGGDVRLLSAKGASHYMWQDNDSVLIWGNGGYDVFKDDGSGQPKERLWTAPNGHQSFIPGTNREWLVTDTYSTQSDREQIVYLCHRPTRRFFILGRFRSPKEYAGEWRCDTHPRVSRDGKFVVIDSPHGGDGRQEYLIDISRIIAPPVGETTTQPAERAAGALDWPEITSQCRPWAYHWWLGSAVDKENLAREYQRYSDGGLGGVHIIPIYGAKGAESRYLDFLSPKWMEMLSFAVQEAKSKGLGVDVTTGTGWNFGGPNITPDLACRNVVCKRIPFPPEGVLPAELRPQKITIQAVVALGPDGQKETLSDRVDAEGKIAWTPPGAGWSVYVLGHKYVERLVKRAAPGGEGPMLNPFCAAAMQTYLQRFTSAFAAPGLNLPRAMYHDSYEYFGNWSPDLPAEFAKRRGYRLEDELPALAGEGPAERVARVRCDVSETLSDMLIENVFPQWISWCHQRGLLTRNQAHGAPANWLDFYALADIPETEMFQHGGPDPLVSRFDEHIGKANRDPLVCKFASSAAHVAGKRLVAAETGTWLAEHFCETFEELKCEVDLMFLSGVNHVFYHGCVYSPDDAAWPGWLFYASTEMNPRNPLWREARTLNDYVARCQAILQSGVPDNDVLLYWPIHDQWTNGLRDMSVHNMPPMRTSLGEVARQLWERGYGFDYVSDRQLAALKVVDGKLQAPGGATWRVVVVPRCKVLPHTTLARLCDLAGQGIPIVFDGGLPEDVPGQGHLGERQAAFRASLKQLRDTAPKAKVLVGDPAALLPEAGARPEFTGRHPNLMFIRRRHAHGRIYFLVNHDLKPLDTWLWLGTPARSTVILDPLTGRSGVAMMAVTASLSPSVHIHLEPGQSTILRTFEEEATNLPAWSWSMPGAVQVQLAGPWQLEFIAGGPQLPEPRELTELTSWTTGGGAAESFAGTARYRCRFDGPTADAALKSTSPLLLDLGEVKHVARVQLNGQPLGVLIMHPYRLPIPAGLLKTKDNLLEVEVTNLGANRIRDLDRRHVPWKIFNNANVMSIKGKPLDARDWPVFESGLLGPVCIRSDAFATGAGAP